MLNIYFCNPDMEQIATWLIELTSRSNCLLKCNCYTSLIDLNNVLKECIYIRVVVMFNILAIIFQKWIQIKLSNCVFASVQLRKIIVDFFLIN